MGIRYILYISCGVFHNLYVPLLSIRNLLGTNCCQVTAIAPIITHLGKSGFRPRITKEIEEFLTNSMY